MLRLERASYRPVPFMPAVVREGGDAAACILGGLMADEIARITDGIDPAVIGYSMAVSTIMDMPFTSGYLTWSQIAGVIRDRGIAPPMNFTPSYECAGWGFALANAGRRMPQAGYAVILVCDINLLDISFWNGDPNWGDSGFGIAAVLLRLPDVARRGIVTRVARSTQGMGEFCADLRQWLAVHPAGLANVPFLPEQMAQIYGHFLPADRVMPHLHDHWGHCFGSDTWLSFITHIQGGLLLPGSVHTATSASLRGYWAMTELEISPDVQTALIPAPDHGERTTTWLAA
jgi:hypothetical protein